MRAGRSCKRPADDQHEARCRERKPEPPQLEGNEWLHATDLHRPHFERKHGRAGEQRDRQQEMQHHDRPAQVAGDRKQADRRLQERAEKNGE